MSENDNDDFSDLGDIPQPTGIDPPIAQRPPGGGGGGGGHPGGGGPGDNGGLSYHFWQDTISPIHRMVQVPHAIDWWKQWADHVLTEVVERIGPPQIELLPNAQELERVADLCLQLDRPRGSDPWDIIDELWHRVDVHELEPGKEADGKLFLLLHRLMRS